MLWGLYRKFINVLGNVKSFVYILELDMMLLEYLEIIGVFEVEIGSINDVG